MVEGSQWRRCSACKKPIPFGSVFWNCSISTCNHKRTGLVFCSVSCWEVHLPVAKHREAWAVEKTAPAGPEEEKGAGQVARAPEPRRRVVKGVPSQEAAPAPQEVLIIASRLKDYVRARSGFNTSDRVLGPLSEIVRRICDEAIENATRAERKTVLDRDIPRDS